jgi:3-methylcrotonyl-CoA carboxylase alpha subunit/acetyl-CoA/propionyl-CoA carboxylase biotin carboxyl carrier protein
MDSTDPVTQVIRTVLVANRGEIALRVFRTCARLEVRTVAIYTDVDAAAPHVRAADEAVRVSSYLDIDAVVAAAVAARADAIHPGYGFLSERAAFARAVEAAGIRLVGPSADVMDAMGRKDHAREIAVRADVPVIPSYDVGGDPETFGYPVLVKAAAGGGGKGMRVVRSAGEYAAALAAATREAASAFGDDTMLVETFVESGRHLEVQVLGDTHGELIHLYERDCSTQRRHQKVLEEAPGPTVDPGLRHRLTSAAVALAREVGYTNAGTVEFLLDDATGDFYFLEMNTRLQVEHPVTEAITGCDLVEEQLRIAAGAPLSLHQDELMGIRGHAIEARVYAEDSFGGFLPQAGTTSLVRWPAGEGIRVDHALEGGQVVSTSYDPMLGKIVAHGPDRETARRALVAALDETAILGLTTNAGFLRALVAGDAFRDATIDTSWLDDHEVPPPDEYVPRVMAGWVSAMLAAFDTGHPFQADGFRLGGPPAPIRVALDRDVVVDRAGGTVDGVPVRQLYGENHVLELEIDGHRERAVVNVQPDIVEVSYQGQRFVLTGPDRLADAETVSDGTVVSPMPGTVLDVRVAEGDQVTEGRLLGMMEAMKMELSLTAPFAGTVTKVAVAPGAQVALGAVLFEVEADRTQGADA